MAALFRGAGPERLCALVLVLMVVVDDLVHFLLDRPATFITIDISHAVIDVAAAAAFILIALWANRLYTLCLAALQILSVIAHPVRSLGEEIDPVAYGILAFFPFTLEMVILSLGIAFHVRRTMKHGHYRSWRSSSGRSQGKPPTK